jgi:MoaA/NifB/PqqE/SkfB family radical SAM enzyme
MLRVKKKREAKSLLVGFVLFSYDLTVSPCCCLSSSYIFRTMQNHCSDCVAEENMRSRKANAVAFQSAGEHDGQNMNSMNRVMQALKVAGSLLRYKVNMPRPFFVSYQITLRCNRRCMFCDAWRTKTFNELKTRHALKVVRELGDTGVAVLGITGGEPLMRTDLEEIAECARHKGIIVGLNTNGTLLTPKRAKSISRVFDTVFVSLDGFEKTHDGIRGEKGTFKEAIIGLKNLLAVKRECTVGVNFVLNSANYKEFLPFCNWIKNRGIALTFFPVGGEDKFTSAYSIPRDEVDDFVRDVLKEKASNRFLGPSENVIRLIPKFVKGKMPHICDAGHLYLGVTPAGDLRICPIGPDSSEWKVGSLVDSSMVELLESSRFRQALEARKHCKPCLAGCTTPYSLLFRASAKDLMKEALMAYRIMSK